MVDWTGIKYADIDISWDYCKCTCRCTVDNYIKTVLTKYKYPHPKKPQTSPHQHTPIKYGTKQQFTKEADTSLALDDSGVKRVQGIVGALLYFA